MGKDGSTMCFRILGFSWGFGLGEGMDDEVRILMRGGESCDGRFVVLLETFLVFALVSLRKPVVFSDTVQFCRTPPEALVRKRPPPFWSEVLLVNTQSLISGLLCRHQMPPP